MLVTEWVKVLDSKASASAGMTAQLRFGREGKRVEARVIICGDMSTTWMGTVRGGFELEQLRGYDAGTGGVAEEAGRWGEGWEEG